MVSVNVVVLAGRLSRKVHRGEDAAFDVDTSPSGLDDQHPCYATDRASLKTLSKAAVGSVVMVRGHLRAGMVMVSEVKELPEAVERAS